MKSNDGDCSASCSKRVSKCTVDKTTRPKIVYYVTLEDVICVVVEGILYKNVHSTGHT